MDPIITAIAKTAEAGLADVAKENSHSFLKAVLHEPAQELGSLLGDKIRERRHQNLIKITARAQERLKGAGYTARQIPLSIVHPALDAASFEEDPNLQETWSNLLASAATSNPKGCVYPSFPSILKELTATDVKFLDALFEATFAHGKIPLEQPLERAYIAPQIVMRIYVSVVSGKNLDKLHGQEAMDLLQESIRGKNMSMETFERNNIVIKEFSVSGGGFDKLAELGFAYVFTNLGASFVSACRGPQAQ